MLYAVKQMEFLFGQCSGLLHQPVDEPAPENDDKGASLRSGLDENLTISCFAILQNLGMLDLAHRVRVVWNPRMRSTAGRAMWPEALIELNPLLKKVAPHEVKRTMLHELAHLLAYARAGRRRIKAHGNEWRQACADVGIPREKVTHSLPLPSRSMHKKWRYTCSACGVFFDRVRRIKRYAGCYACCQKYNDGYYDKKFRLVESQLGQV